MNASDKHKEIRSSRPLRALMGVMALAILGLAWLPGQAQAWWNEDWSYRKPITLEAGPSGANLGQDLEQVPVLIRLHEGIFTFTDAQTNGADLRFIAEDDSTPLPYHVEKFDPVFNMAYIWVQVPKLAAGAPTRLWMYYGNPDAPQAGNPAETFDSAQVAVYHFRAGENQSDVTAYRNQPSQSLRTLRDGLIGDQGELGVDSRMVIPASPSTTVPAGGPFTWSAWFKLESSQNSGVLLRKTFNGGELAVRLDQGAPYLSLNNQGAVQNSSPSFPVADGAWHQLSVVGDGQRTVLYVDGREGATINTPPPALNGDLILGGGAVAAAPGNGDTAAGETASSSEAGGDATAPPPPAGALIGNIDEVRLANEARAPTYLNLQAGNQGVEDRLVVYGEDEQTADWGEGYLGILLGSVTLDGWIVIALLIVMALISWVVMAQKGMLISRVRTGNNHFMDIYRGARGLHDINVRKLRENGASGSPLYRLFETGMRELAKRLDDVSEREQLTPQSIEAIRSELDSQLVQENQSLNKRIVLLTIAISGGPFLGLLGTVVGVMITFAAIAAAGDVNVNAIAPGIAAALVATVAGLAVAIPALFGYNYLLTRIKETTAQLQVFADGFITRLAENYDQPDALRQMASGH